MKLQSSLKQKKRYIQFEILSEEQFTIKEIETAVNEAFKDFLGVSESAALNDSFQIEHLFSEETETKLFSFMKILACTCDNIKS